MNNYKFEKITVNDFDSLYEVMENSFPSIERRKYEEQKDLFYVVKILYFNFIN
ncbi:hypothetical protein AB2T63_08875 [Clostridium butyricum]|uniref:Uncharacterized protein n=1 Tax=Clostridium butyricum TaxID=1492 RepID=A0A512TI14_CLOBU|nr:hypothetical protein [Clostridium butyricum]MDK2829487.1 hypothetical protein [Clostridium butyricum]NOW24668.1 hypothetical protein [Clostridium butyricum]GEQ19768.1 hypothetical protein CBU02nite_02740 [Clostridium butyricum]